MKPHTDEPGSVDGGWWPWSTDPATEFPPLITAMAALWLPVQRVSYDLDAWDAVGLGLTVHGTVVRMEGFRTTRPHTVAPVGPDRVRTRLLVIPPATPGDAARAAMRAAAHTGSTATVEASWSGTTSPPGVPAPPPSRAGGRSSAAVDGKCSFTRTRSRRDRPLGADGHTSSTDRRRRVPRAAVAQACPGEREPPSAASRSTLIALACRPAARVARPRCAFG